MNPRVTNSESHRRYALVRDGMCRAGGWVVTYFAISGALGCSAILGVEEATCDPKFDEACRTGAVETQGAATTDDEATSAREATTAPADETSAPAATPTLEEACAEYCDVVIDACEEVMQFKTAAGCKTVCENMFHLAEGSGAGENSVQCHTQAANSALNFSDGLEANCVAAGPMGLSCGGACNNYCQYIERFCPEEFEKMNNCLAECRNVPRADVPYTDGFPGGNTLECRVYHVQLAVLQQPDRLVHCGHAVGKSVCVGE